MPISLQSARAVMMYMPDTEFLANIPQLEDDYEQWRDSPMYLVLKRNKNYVRFKCAKRGNDVYCRRLKSRLDRLAGGLPDIDLFNPRGVNERAYTLFLTLTHNQKCSVKQAWEEVASRWNRFITKVRQHYGKVWAFRVFERTRNNYPHVHAVLFFKNADFSVFKEYSKKSHRYIYRIEEKDEFVEWEHPRTKRVVKMWDAWVDVQAVLSSRRAFRYLTKYLTKQTPTQTMAWIFRKQAYSISSSDLIPTKRSSKGGLGRGDSLYQFIGLVPSSLFKDGTSLKAVLTRREVREVFAYLAVKNRGSGRWRKRGEEEFI